MFPPQWSHDLLFYIGFNKENLKKIFLSETTRLTALKFGM